MLYHITVILIKYFGFSHLLVCFYSESVTESVRCIVSALPVVLWALRKDSLKQTRSGASVWSLNEKFLPSPFIQRPFISHWIRNN